MDTYGNLAPQSKKDGMSPDHIPSLRAIQEVVERRLGRDLSPSEIRQLRKDTNAIVYGTTTHQKHSRTYGVKNTPTQYQNDANDLEAAFRRDRDHIRPHLINDGHDPADIDRAFRELDAKNTRDGLY